MEVRNATPDQTRRLRMMAYMVLASFGILGFWRVEAINNRVDKESKQRTIQQCESVNDNRKTILSVVEFVAEDNGQPTNFASVPGFDALDLETQEYLINLGSGSASSRENGMDEFVEFARELASPLDCKKLVDGPPDGDKDG